ncbi:hypothetical protein [Methylocystis sp.]|uniref:hypothetical protein n=1 Tax=Methylocystis sp. TaxID=1911079 RepID=UPI002737272F|nr:hypothetical protein [Methylocystis sp.]MDP3554824.1 hypothetical protein [Methylocystis sp.]
MTKAWDDILAERERQKSVEGWSEEHDDRHEDEQLALAAACYMAGGCMEHVNVEASYSQGYHPFTGARFVQKVRKLVPLLWPWSPDWWKPKDRRRDIVRACALGLAEIERIDRRRNG